MLGKSCESLKLEVTTPLVILQSLLDTRQLRISQHLAYAARFYMLPSIVAVLKEHKCYWLLNLRLKSIARILEFIFVEV